MKKYSKVWVNRYVSIRIDCWLASPNGWLPISKSNRTDSSNPGEIKVNLLKSLALSDAHAQQLSSLSVRNSECSFHHTMINSCVRNFFCSTGISINGCREREQLSNMWKKKNHGDTCKHLSSCRLSECFCFIHSVISSFSYSHSWGLLDLFCYQGNKLWKHLHLGLPTSLLLVVCIAECSVFHSL